MRETIFILAFGPVWPCEGFCIGWGLVGPPAPGFGASNVQFSTQVFRHQCLCGILGGNTWVPSPSLNTQSLGELRPVIVTGYPLSLLSKTLSLLPSPPAHSFCDLQVLATSQQILSSFAETPSTLPSHSTTLFDSANLRPHGPHTSALCQGHSTQCSQRDKCLFCGQTSPTSHCQ